VRSPGSAESNTGEAGVQGPVRGADRGGTSGRGFSRASRVPARCVVPLGTRGRADAASTVVMSYSLVRDQPPGQLTLSGLASVDNHYSTSHGNYLSPSEDYSSQGFGKWLS
jgi:hypothetical protein